MVRGIAVVALLAIGLGAVATAVLARLERPRLRPRRAVIEWTDDVEPDDLAG